MKLNGAAYSILRVIMCEYCETVMFVFLFLVNFYLFYPETASTDLSSATLRNPKNTSQLISIEESRALFNKQQAIVKVRMLIFH